jgi:hypothetical protein
MREDIVDVKSVGPFTIFVLSCLVFSIFCSAVRIEIGAVGISLTHLMMPFVLVFMLLKAMSLSQYRLKLSVDNSSKMLYTVWAISLTSTLLYSGFPTRSITGIINFSSFIILFVLTQSFTSGLQPQILLQALLRAVKISSLIGFGCLIVALVSGETNIGATYDHVSQQNIGIISKPIPSIRSLSIEPNLFGISTATILAMLVAAYLVDKSRGMLVSIIGLGLVLMLSYTRSAIIGLAVATLVTTILLRRWSTIFAIIRFSLLGILIAFLTLLSLPDESSFKKAISYKFGSGIVDFSGGTAIPRVVSFHESVNGFVKSPLIGNGVFSANNVFVNPHTFEVTGTAGPIGWLNGLFIQSLHDTGVLGLGAWFLFFFFLFSANYRAYKKLGDSNLRNIPLSFIAGNVVILVGSQASSVVWISFPFVYWAINLSILRYFRGLRDSAL